MSSLLRGHCRPEVGSAAKYYSGDVVSSYFSKTSTREEVQVKENGNVRVQKKQWVTSDIKHMMWSRRWSDDDPQVKKVNIRDEKTSYLMC